MNIKFYAYVDKY